MLRVVAFLGLFGLSILTNFATAQEANQRVKLLTEKAQGVIESLEGAQWGVVINEFDATMQKALPEEALMKTWTALNKQFGKVQKSSKTRHLYQKPYDIVITTCEFQRGLFDLKLVYDEKDKIAGLFLLPSGSYSPPAYARADDIQTRDVTIGKGLLNVTGTLMLPKTASKTSPVPAVVLVHGSGPQDRDETIGPNKPFLDLAYGLSAKGIAVLRYEKRTKQFSAAMALQQSSLTVKEETIDDVVAAVELLREQEEIQADKIFVAGHSLGGMLLPRIAKRTPDAAGYIGLAAAARPLEDVILQQTTELLNAQQPVGDEEKAQLAEIAKQVALVKSPELNRKTRKEDLPLSIPAVYWLDLRGYEPAKETEAIQKPILLVQAGRDYQVTDDDWKLWQSALKDKANCQLKLYPALNHLFMTGEGRSQPAEYTREGHVDEQLISDIAQWVASAHQQRRP